MATEYHIHAVYNPNQPRELVESLKAMAVAEGIPVEEILAPELFSTLDERGYLTWFMAMVSIDRSFIMAPYHWERGEHYVSSNGDAYHVHKVVI